MQQAPFPAPINAGGQVSPEWILWFQLLHAWTLAVESSDQSSASAVAALESGLSTPGGAAPVPLALLVNGRATGSQAKLNLAQGANVTLSDNGAGTVAISAAPGDPPGSAAIAQAAAMAASDPIGSAAAAVAAIPTASASAEGLLAAADWSAFSAKQNAILGASGTFLSVDAKTVTVVNGTITAIV